MQTPSLSRQLATVRASLLTGDPHEVVFDALGVMWADISSDSELIEVIETIAAVITFCWSIDGTTPVDLLLSAIPEGWRTSIGTIAARSALGSLVVHPTPGAHRAVSRATRLVVDSANGDKCWEGTAGWCQAKADREMGDPDWAARMELACTDLESCLERPGGDRASVVTLLSSLYAELGTHYASSDRDFEAAAHMARAVDYARESARADLPRRLAELAFLEARTRRTERIEAHVAEAVNLLGSVQSPGEDDFAAIKVLLALGGGALGSSGSKHLLDVAAALIDRTEPSNDVAVHLVAVAERYERRSSWSKAREQWQRIRGMTSALGLDGVHGLTAQLGLVRTSIELGDISGASAYLEQADQLLIEWPDDDSRRSVDLYRAVLSQ